MLESIEFTNYKALRKTTLPLRPFTLLLGPNGSGKTSVLQALRGIAALPPEFEYGNWAIDTSHWLAARSITADRTAIVQTKLRLRLDEKLYLATFQGHSDPKPLQGTRQLNFEDGGAVPPAQCQRPLTWLFGMRTYALDATAIAQSSEVSAGPFQSNGVGLAAVLDDLKDNDDERWRLLLAEMREWLPEYDSIQFDKPQGGRKSIVLRTKVGQHRIPATELSQGTLIALALLTLAYLPNPPTLVAFEEIDRGLHPRLLRHLQDALYRLSYPESCGEKRPPIQVIATTHSPYLLDLYRDHPEEVVLAQKEGLEVQFRRLSDMEHFKEILGDAPLSEVWYSGVLGGVSVKP